MNLKDGFRYQNFLQNNINVLCSYLVNESNVTITKENHHISSVIKDKADKIVERKKEDKFADATVMDVIDFLVSLQQEKEELTIAIDNAKAKNEVRIDSVVSINKDLQEIIYTLNRMINIVPKEYESFETEYAFNAEGNQVEVKYPVEIVSTIDFDRNAVKTISKRFKKHIDETSSARDITLLSCSLEFEPRYDINDSLEDMVKDFLSKKK